MLADAKRIWFKAGEKKDFAAMPSVKTAVNYDELVQDVSAILSK